MKGFILTFLVMAVLCYLAFELGIQSAAYDVEPSQDAYTATVE